MSKLDETYSFLDLYVHAAGKWKTPVDFHRWSCLALIAACVEDRVFMDIFEHAPLYPNVWTFLVGGSGIGKDHAIGFALSLLETEDPIMMVDGKITVPAMYDLMAKYQKETGRDSAPMFLVSSDLPEQLPPGPESIEFTSRVLQLYGGRKRILADHTRTSGDKYIRNPLLNWLAGVVPRWFPKAVHPDVFHSGLAGRVLFINGEKDQRYAHLRAPILPPDYDLIRVHLRDRVKLFLQVFGSMRITKKAERLLDAWLFEHSQQRPRNDIEEAIHERKLSMLLKLTTLLALCEWTGGDLVAKAGHLGTAISLLPTVERGVRKIGEFVYKTQDTINKEIVEDLIRAERKVTRSRLIRFASGRGIKDAKHLDSILDMLKQGSVIIESREKQESTGRWVKFYGWNERRGLKALVNMMRKKDESKKDEAAAPDEESAPEGDQGNGEGPEGEAD